MWQEPACMLKNKSAVDSVEKWGISSANGIRIMLCLLRIMLAKTLSMSTDYVYTTKTISNKLILKIINKKILIKPIIDKLKYVYN